MLNYATPAMTPALTPAQTAALAHVEQYAAKLRTVGLAELDNVLAMSNVTREAFETAQDQIRRYARVGLQFHPDRIGKDGRSVAQSLAEDGRYRNQFETHVSNGRLDLFADGMRAAWEDAIFGGVFSAHGATFAERPKYGALDLMLFPDGPCPRYGSCYILLKPAVSERCTFTYMDSHREPMERGTLKQLDPVVAALMTECFERRFALGCSAISPRQLVCHLTADLSRSTRDRLCKPYMPENIVPLNRHNNLLNWTPAAGARERLLPAWSRHASDAARGSWLTRETSPRPSARTRAPGRRRVRGGT